MPNFSNRIAIRVSDKVFSKSMINGLWIRTALERIGYYVGDLRFYPNKPYLCTFYKGDSGRLGTTNTPFKEGRTVIEEWNQDLFFAMCCQQDGNYVQTGEFYTDNKTGNIYRCTSLDGEWIRTDLPGKGNVAFKKVNIHKSTIQELTDHFSVPAIINDDLEVKTTAKRGRQQFWENADKESKASTENAIKASAEILEAKKGMTLEEMTIVAEKHEVDLVDNIEAIPQLAHPQIGETVIDSKDQWINIGCAEMSGDELYHTKRNIDDMSDSYAPMTFQEILQWFGEGNDVCVGTIDNGEVSCKTYQIEGITKTAVQLTGKPYPSPFNEVFRNTAEFLKYALQQIA